MRRGSMLALLLVSACGDNEPSIPEPVEDTRPAIDAAIPTNEVTPSDASDDVIVDAVDAADVGLPSDYPLPPIPAACTRTAQVVTYAPNGWDSLVDAFEANVSPCVDYLVHIPAMVGDKTRPRGPLQPARIRARKGRFFAVAEFHYGAWSADTTLTWFEKGVEFRKRMDAAGYNVARGDTWAIDELPITLRTDPEVRANVKAVVRGLHTGASGSPGSAGAVFVLNISHETTNLTTYEGNLRSWLTDATFWTELAKYVRFWGQEAYPSATRVCVASASIAGRAERVNDFVMHPGRHAYSSGAPSSAASARAFFDASYMPLMSAFWKSAGPYGDTMVSLDTMQHHVSLQVYAARVWRESHLYPAGRMGFAWDESAGTAPNRVELATRLAQSIRDAHAPGATPARACSPSGAYTWCDCSMTGAAFNDVWKTFSTW